MFTITNTETGETVELTRGEMKIMHYALSCNPARRMRLRIAEKMEDVLWKHPVNA